MCKERAPKRKTAERTENDREPVQDPNRWPRGEYQHKKIKE